MIADDCFGFQMNRMGHMARVDLDIGGSGVFRTGTSRQKGRLLDAYSVRSATIG